MTRRLVVLLLVTSTCLATVKDYDLAGNYNNLPGSDAHGYGIYGAKEFDVLGLDVVALGDVNSDALDDFAVLSGGALMIVYGSPEDRPSALDTDYLAAGGLGITITDPGDWHGHGLAFGSDLNDDGLPDITFNTNNHAYVLFGQEGDHLFGQHDFDVTTMDASVGIHTTDTGYTTFFGIGDFNNDSVDDFVCSVEDASVEGTNHTGAVFILFGHEGPWEDLPHSDATDSLMIIGPEGTYLGSEVADAGDFNGDGLADILVTGVGGVYLIFGRTTGYGYLNLSEPDFGGFRVTDDTGTAELGYSLGGGSDLNQDGLDDIIIGAPNAGPYNTGAALILFGSNTAHGDIELQGFESGTDTGFVVTGAASFSQAGYGVSMPGDLDGDSYPDLWVYTHGDGAGVAIYGRAHYKDTSLSTLEEDGYTAKRFLGIDTEQYAVHHELQVAAVGHTKSRQEHTVVISSYSNKYPYHWAGVVFVLNSVDDMLWVEDATECQVQVTMDDSVDYVVFVSSEVAAQGGMSLEYGDAQSNCQAMTVNSLDVGTTSQGGTHHPLVWVFLPVLVPILLVSGKQAYSSPTTMVTLACHCITGLMALLSMFYSGVYALTSSPSLTGLAVVTLTLGFMLETLLVVGWAQVPLLSSQLMLGPQMHKLGYTMMLAMGMVLVTSITSLATRSAALALAIIGMLPTSLVCGLVYLASPGRDYWVYSGVLLGLGQQLSAILYACMAYQGKVLTIHILTWIHRRVQRLGGPVPDLADHGGSRKLDDHAVRVHVQAAHRGAPLSKGNERSRGESIVPGTARGPGHGPAPARGRGHGVTTGPPRRHTGQSP